VAEIKNRFEILSLRALCKYRLISLSSLMYNGHQLAPVAGGGVGGAIVGYLGRSVISSITGPPVLSYPEVTYPSVTSGEAWLTSLSGPHLVAVCCLVLVVAVASGRLQLRFELCGPIGRITAGPIRALQRPASFVASGDH
jgi:hypothetical protein